MYSVEEFLKDLNPSQRKLFYTMMVLHLLLPVQDRAKTRVLTYKIAYLLQTGYAPYNILALTLPIKRHGR